MYWTQKIREKMWRQNPSSLCVCVIWICNNPKQNCERKDLKLQRKWTNSCCCTGFFKEFIFPENLVQKFRQMKETKSTAKVWNFRQMKKPKNLLKSFPKNFLFVFQSFGFTDFQTTKNKKQKKTICKFLVHRFSVTNKKNISAICKIHKCITF